MLNMVSDRYTMSSLPAREDKSGVYFPDSVVKPFIDALPPVAASSADISARRFTLDEAKSLIVEAFTDFNPQLGHHSRALFSTAQFNPRPRQDVDFTSDDYHLDVEENSRWSIHEVPSGTTPRVMRSVAAFSERLEHDPPNPSAYAIIEFDFDGTIDSVIYMAHEAGHAIADDNIAKPEGYAHGDNGDPVHMAETQAYFTQHIVYDYLKRHPDTSIADAARGHYLHTLAKNVGVVATAAKTADSVFGNARDKAMGDLHFRPIALLSADAVFQHVAGKEESARAWASDLVLGRYGPKNIAQVFAGIGIESSQQMESLVAATLKHAATGLPVIKNSQDNEKSGGPSGKTLAL